MGGHRLCGGSVGKRSVNVGIRPGGIRVQERGDLQAGGRIADNLSLIHISIKQSDGTLLTPFQQAKRYITELPLSQHPRWVVTCNFSTFYIYDMERPGGEPEIVELENLPQEYYRLQFLVDTRCV